VCSAKILWREPTGREVTIGESEMRPNDIGQKARHREGQQNRPYGRPTSVLKVFGVVDAHGLGAHMSGLFQETHYFVGLTVSGRIRSRRQAESQRDEAIHPHSVLDLFVHGVDDLELVWRHCGPAEGSVLVVATFYGSVCYAVSYGRAALGLRSRAFSPRVLALARRALEGTGTTHVYLVAESWPDETMKECIKLVQDRQLSDVVSIDGESAAVLAGLIDRNSAEPVDERGRITPAGLPLRPLEIFVEE
jgi:hypothetical protein